MNPPFQRIFDKCTDLFPFMATQPMKLVQATTLINEWLNAGCDADKDIIPTITTLWSKCPTKITSLAYFNTAILAARDARVGSVEHLKQRNESYAKTLKIRKRTGVYVSDHDEAWLKQHEQREEPRA